MMKKYLLPALFFGLTVFTSCQKEQEIAPTKIPVEANSEASKLDQTALALAKSLESPDLRIAIKNEASKKFDGDFNILYSKFKDKKVQGYSIRERLAIARSNISFNSSMRVNLANAVEEIDSITDVDKLQVSVPVNCEEWKAGDYTPLVAIVPDDFDEKTTKLLKAYDYKGNIHWLDAKVAPTVPVIVVGRSERVDEKGNVKKLYTPENQSGSNLRTAGYAEYMTQLKCPDLGQIEAWALGAPELKWFVLGALNNVAYPLVNGMFYEPNKRKDIDNKFVTIDRFLFTWNRPDFADYIKIKFIEEDGGGIQGLTVSLAYKYGDIKTTGEASATVSYDFSKGVKDDDAGEMVVWQGDALTREYNTGLIIWTLDSRP
jgi:hypothetical protein